MYNAPYSIPWQRTKDLHFLSIISITFRCYVKIVQIEKLVVS